MRIIIFKEKHGDRYFDASTEWHLDAACATIIKERYEDGLYGPPRSAESYLSKQDREILESRKQIPDEAFGKLPEPMRDQFKKAEDRLAGFRMIESEELNMWGWIETIATRATLQEAIDLGWHPGRSLAYHIIDLLSCGEYEGYQIEDIEEPSW